MKMRTVYFVPDNLSDRQKSIARTYGRNHEHECVIVITPKRG